MAGDPSKGGFLLLFERCQEIWIIPRAREDSFSLQRLVVFSCNIFLFSYGTLSFDFAKTASAAVGISHLFRKAEPLMRWLMSWMARSDDARVEDM